MNAPDERLGRWNFWVTFIGFNLGFFPTHISGLMGMPRRISPIPKAWKFDRVFSGLQASFLDPACAVIDRPLTVLKSGALP
jgi:heme/copper-type cytochrome/quinol oxidase subunit 1